MQKAGSLLLVVEDADFHLVEVMVDRVLIAHHIAHPEQPQQQERIRAGMFAHIVDAAAEWAWDMDIQMA